MLSFQHPNIMSLLGVCFDEEIPLLIMPFLSGGNVLGFVRHNKEMLCFVEEPDGDSQVVHTDLVLEMKDHSLRKSV